MRRQDSCFLQSNWSIASTLSIQSIELKKGPDEVKKGKKLRPRGRGRGLGYCTWQLLQARGASLGPWRLSSR